MAVKPQLDMGSLTNLLLRKAYPKAHYSQKMTAQLCTRISQVYLWASRANTSGLQEAIERHIHAIAYALAHGTEVDLELQPPPPASNEPLTLAQQFCQAVAEVYAAAARDPSGAFGLERHLEALDAVVQSARDLWDSDGAAARYLERPSPQFDGKTPLDAATRSCDAARRVEAAIKSASTNLARVEGNAKRMLSRRPSPTSRTVDNAALALLGDRAQADAFLERPHPLLAGRSPRGLAAESPEGAARVERLIRQAQAGTAI